MGVHSEHTRQRMLETFGPGMYDPRRRTGRTTTMLLDVVKEILSDTKHVVVIALNERFARDYQRQVNGIMEALGITLQRDEKIEFLSIRNLRGDPHFPNTKVFMDHAAYDNI